MDWDEERQKSSLAICLGEDLSTLSIEELRHRVKALHDEIARIEAEIGAKKVHGAAADSVFKS